MNSGNSPGGLWDVNFTVRPDSSDAAEMCSSDYFPALKMCIGKSINTVLRQGTPSMDTYWGVNPFKHRGIYF